MVGISFAVYAVVRHGGVSNSTQTAGNTFLADGTSSVLLAPAQAAGERAAPERCGQTSALSTCVEYRSAKYHFSLFYPSVLGVKTYDEGGGAMTIVFENAKLVQGFQIFVVPYSQPQVTEQRFKQDEPSGVRTNVQNIQIDGAVGAAFFSKNALGDTYEVWFIHGGYLFEVTALRQDEDELNDALRTWQFI